MLRISADAACMYGGTCRLHDDVIDIDLYFLLEDLLKCRGDLIDNESAPVDELVLARTWFRDTVFTEKRFHGSGNKRRSRCRLRLTLKRKRERKKE
jgi:hypothetical protein